MRKITFLFVAILMAISFATAATGWYNDFLTVKVNGVETANNYYIGGDPSTGATAFQGKAFGTVSSLELSNIDMKYWSDTQDRTGGSLFYKITAEDGITNVVAPYEIIWAHASIGGNDYQGTKPAAAVGSLNFLKGLPTGNYQLHIWAKSWGSNQGDSWLSNNSANYVATFSVNRPVTVSGTLSPTDNTYATLKAAIDSINAHSDYANKDIEIKISGNTTETASVVLNQPTTASWNSLTIYPTSTNVTIAGNFIGTLLDLNGADKVNITGKLNKTGAGKNLTISQSESTDNTSRTIRFINDAVSDTIQYCTVTGKCPSTGAGVIFFSTTTLTAGNNNNTIKYCDINAAGAAVGVGSVGSAIILNNGNSLLNNNIYDFYLSNTSTSITYGINIGANNNSWTISGNSIYQTASKAYSATATYVYGIYIISGNSNVIENNYIGGSAPNAGGTPWTTSGGQIRPYAMYTQVGTTTATSIQGNVITNFDITTDYAGNANVFIGHWHQVGAVNVGTVTGNTIGSTSATGAIKVKFTGAAAGTAVLGMNIFTGAGVSMVFSNNKIGGIIADFNNTVNRGHVYGVVSAGAGALTFTNNTIGSTTVANSIEHKGSTYTGGAFNLRGLSLGNAGAATITGNTIANLTNSSTVTSTTNGIYENGAGVNTISSNTVRDIKTSGSTVIATQGIAASLIGILFNSNSAGNVIAGNTIYNLENSNTSAAVDAYGINFHSLNAGASIIQNNKIYNITTLSSATASVVSGINITRGLTTTKNNMITLGSGITNAINISGIRKDGTAITQNDNFYHNSVLITGSGVGVAGTTSTSAFVRVLFSSTDEVKNNIFINERSNAVGNTQKHYAFNIVDNTTLTSNNNVVNASGTGGVIGVVGSTDYATLNDWTTATSQDAASKVSTAYFTNSSVGDLSLTGNSIQDANLAVPRLATVLTDFTGSNRNASTYAGAYESTPFIFTAVNPVLSSANILPTTTGVKVSCSKLSDIEIYTVNGILVDKVNNVMTFDRNLKSGIYLIKVNNETTKFIK